MTKLYYYTFGGEIVVAYLAKGSANGDLGWFLNPMKRIKTELSNSSQAHDPNSLVSLLQVADMMPLHDRD